MKNLLLIYFTITLSTSFSQDKVIKSAIQFVEEKNYEKAFDLCKEYEIQKLNTPFGSYIRYRIFYSSGSSYFNLDSSYLRLEKVINWSKENETEKKWCKSIDLCPDKLQLTLDSIAWKAFENVKQKKEDKLYQTFFSIYKNSNYYAASKSSYEDWKFDLAKESNTIIALESFIKLFPNSTHIIEANKQIEDIEYEKCKSSNEIATIEKFIKKYPNSSKNSELKDKVIDLEYYQCNTNINCLENFVAKYPSNSKHFEEAQKTIEKLKFENAKIDATKEALETFITNYPNSTFVKEAKKMINDLTNGVIITTFGMGNSSEEATRKGLENAIERVYGTFISKNTQALNISSNDLISSELGYVSSYSIVDELKLAEGKVAVILKSIILIDKLNEYIKAKGAEVEIEGGLFTKNIKQQLLNEQAELDLVTNIFGILYEEMQQAFDYTVNTSEPKSLDNESSKWSVNVNVVAKANKRIDFCFKTLIKSLSGICMSSEEVNSYKKLNKPVFQIAIDSARLWKDSIINKEIDYGHVVDKYYETDAILNYYYFRKEASANIIISLFNQFDFYLRNFEVKNNISSCRGCGNSISLQNIFKNRYDINKRYHGKWRGGDIFHYDFPRFGDTSVIFEYQDIFTLEELNKISKYSVSPLGVRVKIKHGGYVIYEDENEGVVMSIADYPVDFEEKIINQYGNVEIDKLNLLTEKIAKISMGGFSDWMLPTEAELTLLKKNVLIPNRPFCKNESNVYSSEIFKEDDNKGGHRGYNSLYDKNIYFRTGREKDDFLQKDFNKSEILPIGPCGFTSSVITRTINCGIGSFGTEDFSFNFDSLSIPIEINYPKLTTLHNHYISVSPFLDNENKGENNTSKINLRLVHHYKVENKETSSTLPKNAIKVGKQIWMNKNLTVTKFRNGDLIKEAKSDEEWEKGGPSWCYYNNDPSTEEKYGKLYNYAALTDKRGLAPEGWAIPSVDDFRILHLEVAFDVEKIKSISGWDKFQIIFKTEQNSSLFHINGTNETGFNLFPIGQRTHYGGESFFQQDRGCGFWTSTKAHFEAQMYKSIFTNIGFLLRYPEANQASGLPIRCIWIGE